MSENPAFISDIDKVSRQDPTVDSVSVQINVKVKDDSKHSSDDELDQNRRRSDTASFMIILNQTSSRLVKSISNVSEKFKSPTSIEAKQWPKLKLPQNKSATRSFGLFLAFLSGVLMTTYSSMIKMLDTMDSMQVVVIRGSLQFLIMGSIAMYRNVPFKGAI